MDRRGRRADRSGLDTGDPPRLARALARVIKNRDRFDRALHAFEDSSSTPSVPFAFVTTASIRRDLARLTHDPAGMRAWQGIIDAHATALADRDRVIGMILWHTL